MQSVEIEYGVEYYLGNIADGEQFEYLTECEFIELIRMHQARGFDPDIAYDNFTIYNNGRDGRRLTIKDSWGIYYG